MKYRLNIWQKLFLGFIIVVIFPVLVAGIVSIRLFYTGVEQQAELTLNKDLNAASNMFYQRLDNVSFYLNFLSGHRELSESVEQRQKNLQQLLAELKEQRDLSFLTVVDKSGQVFSGANSEYTANIKDDFDVLIQSAKNKQTNKGVLVLGEAFLEKEGLLEQAFSEIISTPEGKITREKNEPQALAFAASSPIYGQEGNVIAVLVGGDILNNDHRFIDEITELLEVSTSLFFEDLRIATSIRLQEGERALGTRVSEQVTDVVLGEENRYHGRAFIVNEMFLTAFDPIYDVHNNVVGMFCVGIPEAPYVAMKRDTVQQFVIIAAIGVAIAVILAYFITQSIRSPVKKTIDAMKNVELGDLSQRFDGSSKVYKDTESRSQELPAISESLDSDSVKSTGDEIQQLGNFFNKMMESLQANWEKNQELNLKLEEKEKIRNHLMKKIIVSQEEERKRIARELHDETGQSLTSLMLGFKLIKQAESLDKAQELAKNLREITYKTIEEIQWLSYELRPSALDDLGLDVALKRYISELSQHADIEIEFELDSYKGVRLSTVVETTIYRVVQEALTNVIRHSGADQVKVLLQCDFQQMNVIIEDNGVGFDLEQAEKDQQKNLGLFGMKERAVLVGGELFIHTAPGEGTRIMLSIPLEDIENLSKKQHPQNSTENEISGE